MSECSAVVRLQVVHPVPAFLFFFQKHLAKCPSSNSIYERLKEYAELKSLLPADEYSEARASTLNAF